MHAARVMASIHWTLLAMVFIQVALADNINSAETLECHRRLYTFRVTQTDEEGRQCWDTLSVMSCWGRCDSNEISDWRFPYKRSYHPVCVHAGRSKAAAKLRHCEPGVRPGTDRYIYLEAEACRCQACTSSDTSCEGVRYRGHRTHAMTLMALEPDDGGFANDEDNLVD